MKQEYLKTLRSLLDQYRMEKTEKEDIINDYQDMYEGYQSQGMSDDDIEEKLGSPSSIIKELTEGYKKNSEPHNVEGTNRGKIIAIMPFVSLVIFFVLGFGFDLWVYSWLAFLLIPITAIILSMGKNKEVLIAISPFVAVIAFMILGFVYNAWHPGWMVFLIIPVTAIIMEHKTMKLFELLTALSPFVALTIFIMYFGQRNMWEPGWLVFLMIPMIGALNEKNILKLLTWELLFIIGIAGYLYLYQENPLEISLLPFIPVVLFSLWQSNINLGEIPRGYRLVVIISIVGYILLGLLSEPLGVNLWGYAWLIFFLIPLHAINQETGDEKIIAMSPFLAVFIFFTLGYFFDLWAFSWLAFLIIPVIAILKGK